MSQKNDDEPTPAVLFDDCDYSDAHELMYKGVPYTGAVIERGAQGQILSLQHFRRGILDGLSRCWDSKGALQSETDYAFGWPKYLREWHANGQLKRDVLYHASPRTGVVHDNAWDKSGQPVDPRVLDRQRLEK